MQKKSFLWILANAFALGSCLWLQAQASENVLMLDVQANCPPHSDVSVLTDIALFVTFQSSSMAGSSILGELTTTQGEVIPSSGFRFSSPQRDWYTVSFPGPKVASNYYCSQDASPKKLALSITPNQNMRVFFGETKELSPHELPPLKNYSAGSTMNLAQSQDNVHYAAGLNTTNPYWLHFAFPLSQKEIAPSTLLYEFH